MATNSNIEALIIRYLQQEITEKELRVLVAWIKERPENKTIFFELKQLSESNKYPACLYPEKIQNSWQKMKSRIEKEKRFALVKMRMLSFGKYAAVILAAIATGWGLHDRVSHKNVIPAQNQPTAYNEVYIEKGGRKNTLLLSDGTKVILNTATTFKYPTSFSDNKRDVFLDGEAYFEVAKDRKKPFIVHLKHQEIKVLGTSFNVEAYSDERYSMVTLLTGDITLETFNEQGEPMSQMHLKPKQKAFADNRSGSVSIQDITCSVEDSWTKGDYKFKNEPLGQIFKRLEKYYDITIHIEDERIATTRYTGSFSLHQDIREILHIINHEKKYTIKQIKKDIFITSK